jgi:hypothetical protein
MLAGSWGEAPMTGAELRIGVEGLVNGEVSLCVCECMCVCECENMRM